MTRQDPLRRSRLGGKSLLLSATGVVLTSSLLMLPACTGLPEAVVPSPIPTATDPGAAKANLGAEAAPVEGVAAQSPSSTELLPVYWLGGSGSDARLYREFVPADMPGGIGDPIADAVRFMTTAAPLDSDFYTAWESASHVTSSISQRNVITVDISADAFRGRLTEVAARRAIQQLVFTATAAAANAGLITGGEASSVVILVDGKAGYRAFDKVSLDGELHRDTSLVAPVWIANPQNGDVRDPSTVVVNGSGVSDSALLAWRIAAVVPPGAEGAASAGSAMKAGTVKQGTVELDSAAGVPGTYEFTVALPPGHYEISVFRTDGSAPGGAEQDADTKLIEIK